MSPLPRAGRDYPRTVLEFEQFFPDEIACQQYLLKLRWPDGFLCPRCQQQAVAWQRQRGPYVCSACRAEVPLTAGTIFHRSRIPLRTWFQIVWEMTSTKHGTTALDIQRTLGLGSYRTAWRVAHKLRAAMVRPDRELLSGTVEADETYVGGEEAGLTGRETISKAIVAIAVEMKRKHLGRVRLRHVPDVSSDSLIPFLEDSVTTGSRIHTDGWHAYRQLPKAGFRHKITVLSAQEEPAHIAMPGVHRVASLLKRWLLGIEQGGIAPEHLQAYLDEFTFRFNRRSSRARGLLFHRLLEQAVRTTPLPENQIVKGTGRGPKG